MTESSSRYVALNGDMLRLAFAASGLTQAELRRRAGELYVGKSTLSEWLSGKRKRCALRSLKRVAPQLHVPLDLLRGAQTGFQPGCGPSDISPRHGDPVAGLPPTPYVLDENWVRHDPGPRADPNRNLGWPSAYHVVWASFCEVFLWAYRRDVWAEVPSAVDLDHRLLEEYGGSREALTRRVVIVFQREMSIGWAREVSHAMRDTPFGIGVRPPQSVLDASENEIRELPEAVKAWAEEVRASSLEPVDPIEREAARVSFARERAAALWLRLESWIHGRTPLDYSWFEALFRTNLAGPGSANDIRRRSRGLEDAGFWE